jgi:4-amino-4-deoxy-L-arabinose transferase-like glycosyltransferase
MTSARAGRLVLWVLAAVVLARLASLGLYPLLDTTEARYGEIGRKMLASGNWLTPQWDVGVPFWGKPPLSFWASAAGMKLFGVGEFGARFATLVFALATAALFWRWPHAPARREDAAPAAALVLLSSVLGFLIAGAVATDVFMVLGMTLSMVALWNALQGSRAAFDRWGPFVGLGVGLLAKGPVAAVMSGMALFLWLAWTRRVGDAWRALPWGRGLLLTAVLALPWYLAAEAATPGYLHYFIVGEHWQRFTVPGWEGDLYGDGHERPRGSIWLYAAAAAMPWTLVALVLLVGRRRTVDAAAQRPSPDPQMAYLWCWVLAPLVLFTLARNVLEAYALPALPAFALITTRLAMERLPRGADSRVWLLGLAAPVVGAAILLVGAQRIDGRAQRTLLAHPRDESVPLIYLFRRPFSGQFYSGGRALEVLDRDAALAWLASDRPATLLVPDYEFDRLGLKDSPRWAEAARHGGYVMLVPRRATP